MFDSLIPYDVIQKLMTSSIFVATQAAAQQRLQRCEILTLFDAAEIHGRSTLQGKTTGRSTENAVCTGQRENIPCTVTLDAIASSHTRLEHCSTALHFKLASNI